MSSRYCFTPQASWRNIYCKRWFTALCSRNCWIIITNSFKCTARNQAQELERWALSKTGRQSYKALANNRLTAATRPNQRRKFHMTVFSPALLWGRGSRSVFICWDPTGSNRYSFMFCVRPQKKKRGNASIYALHLNSLECLDLETTSTFHKEQLHLFHSFSLGLHFTALIWQAYFLPTGMYCPRAKSEGKQWKKCPKWLTQRHNWMVAWRQFLYFIKI